MNRRPLPGLRLRIPGLRDWGLRDRGLHDLRLRDPVLGNLEPFAAPATETVSRQSSPAPSSANRRIIVTVLVSLGLHAAAVIAVLLLLHAGVPVADGLEKPTEVELVMEEHKGDARPTSAPSPSPPAQNPPAQKVDPSAANTTELPAQQQDAVAPTAEQASPDRPPQDTHPSKAAPVREAKRQSEPAPPAAPPAPVISLQGTDSPSDARAFGDRVIPARPDAVFHNRPPEYPVEAALNGQQGVVVVLVHVSPAGNAVGVDLVRSSGYVLLDSAAQEAVLRWRFLPAVKDGEPVASDMTMGFEFDNLR